MHEEVAYLCLTTITLAAFLAIIASLKIQRITDAVPQRLMTCGSSLFFIGLLFIWLIILIEESGGHSNMDDVLGFILLGIILLGPILFLIGFINFCALWGATGKRRAELIEITSALTALHSAQQNNLSPSPK